MPRHQHLRDLADRLRAVGYTVDGVSMRLGTEAVAALGRNVTIPAQRALGTADDELATLVRLLMLQQEVPAEAAARALGDLTPLLQGADTDIFGAASTDSQVAAAATVPHVAEAATDPQSAAAAAAGVQVPEAPSPARPAAAASGGTASETATDPQTAASTGSPLASPATPPHVAAAPTDPGAAAPTQPQVAAAAPGSQVPEAPSPARPAAAATDATATDAATDPQTAASTDSPLAAAATRRHVAAASTGSRVVGVVAGEPEPLSDGDSAASSNPLPTGAPPLLVRTSGGVRAALDLRPYAVEGQFDGWVVSDLIPTLDGRDQALRPDFVLGISPASTTLAQLAVPGPLGRVLDLGTGCGVQALHLAGRAERVVATDLNPRAPVLADLTAALNGVELDLREGSLYEPVAGERFDLILTNPPYVMSPPSDERLVYREGSLPADDLVRQVVSGAATHLNPGGVLQVLANWAITDRPWQERLAEWIRPTGCDVLVIERERLDPAEYIEIWLADAGLAGAPDHPRRYAEWLDYFETLGITAVGMGWIALYNTGRDEPDLRFDEWPHRVQQPVGQAFADHPAAVTASRLPDGELLASRWRLADHVVQETLGQPGAEDPEHIVLRSGTGFCRAHEVDTALGGVLGACDGDLPLADLIGAVADLLEVDSAELTADLLPRLRTVIADGMLRRA